MPASQQPIQTWFDALGRQPTHTLRSNSQERRFTRGQFIYRSGSQPQALYLIRQGIVGASIISARGSQHLLRLFHSGDYFGHRALFAGEAYQVDALCLEDAEVVQINRALVFAMCKQQPELLHNLAHTLAIQLGFAEQLRVDMQEKIALQRVAEAVVYLLDFDPDHRWTRREIAEFCSTTTETVIRCMSQLIQMELVRQQGRKLIILDRSRLIDFASQQHR